MPVPPGRTAWLPVQPPGATPGAAGRHSMKPPGSPPSAQAPAAVRPGPRKLGPLISRIARRSAGKRGLPTAEILTNWRHIVGPELAPLTVPERVTFPRGAGDGGTLRLRVAAGFAPIVALQEPRIIARLNTYFGYGAIAHIRLVQGPPLPEAVEAAEPSQMPAADSDDDSGPLPALNRLRRALAARKQRSRTAGED